MPQKPNSERIKMTIHKEDEEEGTDKAYQEMYKKYGNLSYSEAYSMMQDAIGILETKCVLGLNKAKLNNNELGVLVEKGKEIGKLAETGEQAIKVRFRYDRLTGRKKLEG